MSVFNWIGSKLKGAQSLGAKVLDGAAWLGGKIADGIGHAADFADSVPLLAESFEAPIKLARAGGKLIGGLANSVAEAGNFVRNPSLEGAGRIVRKALGVAQEADRDPLDYLKRTYLQNVPKK